MFTLRSCISSESSVEKKGFGCRGDNPATSYSDGAESRLESGVSSAGSVSCCCKLYTLSVSERQPLMLSLEPLCAKRGCFHDRGISIGIILFILSHKHLTQNHRL